MRTDSLRINEKRFLRNLAELGQIGRLPESEGGGLDRRPFSPAERAARDYFVQQAKSANLTVVTDEAANLSAKLWGKRPSAPTLLIGSHLDTVPNGGPYDGALGVVAALELLRTVCEANIVLPVHLEAIAFTDEEGRFGDFFGSRTLVGAHTSSSIESFLKRAAAYPQDLTAMSSAVPGGLTPEAIANGRRDPANIAGFIELHIEQGPRLEEAGVSMGVVKDVFGFRSMRIDFHGRRDHAGTTPLHLRADALMAAAHFVIQAPRLVQQQFPNAVVTCGDLTVHPGVHNVVPSNVALLLEFRASGAETLTHMERMLLDLAQECTAVSDHLAFTVAPLDQYEPISMNPSIQTAIVRACDALGYRTMTFSSGALHDAGILARTVPAGMVFVPSINGRSHCPQEDTASADLVAGANVLLHTALILVQEQNQEAGTQ
jgi:N-carbamoyl-L-amino-acid hydrolase